jgi:predicted transcriptional regulator
MPGSGSDDVLEVVTSRAGLLRAIGVDGAEKPTLEEALSVSRSTVDRGVRELLDTGLIQRDDDRYRLTLTGELALANYDRFTSQVEGALAAGDVLEATANSELAVDPVVLEGATIDRDDAVDALSSLVGRASHVWAVVPVAPARQLLETCVDTVVDDSGSAQCVLSDAALGELRRAHDCDLKSLLSTGRVTLARPIDESAPGLLVCEWDDGAAMALVHHNDGAITAVLTNDSPKAVEWAREQFEQRRESAQEVHNPFE